MEHTYLITYDLNRPGQNYSELFEAIKAYGTWAHAPKSVWLIRARDTSTADIRDALLGHLDDNDQLLVVQLSGPAAWKGFSKKVSDWLMNDPGLFPKA